MIWPVTEAQQRAAMMKMWKIFPVGPNDPLHLRAIWGKGVPGKLPPRNITFTPAKYPSITDRRKAFEDRALELNAIGYNIYTCLNVIRPDFEGDEANGISVKDVDIVSRRYLLVDIDRVQTDQPATISELDEISKVAHRIETAFCFDRGEEAISVCSGNGTHVYLPIDLPNDDEAKQFCRDALAKLAAKYDTPTCKVDTAVYNAARITKVLGTVARKGVETEEVISNGQIVDEERCYRMAHFVS